MKKEEMVNGLKKRLVDAGLDNYINTFNELKNTAGLDKFWTDTAIFYEELNEEEKTIFFGVIRQVQIDTLASVLAFLDGTYWVKGQEDDVKLVSLGNPEEELNGELTDTFLNMIYEWER